MAKIKLDRHLELVEQAVALERGRSNHFLMQVTQIFQLMTSDLREQIKELKKQIDAKA